MIESEDTFDNPLSVIGAFVNIAKSLSTETDLDRLLQVLVTSARDIAAADAGLIFVLDRSKRFMDMAVGGTGAERWQAGQLSQLPLYIDGVQNLKHICSRCAFSGGAINTANIHLCHGLDPELSSQMERQLRYRCRSALAVPMRNAKNISLGVLLLLNRKSEQGRIVAFPDHLTGLISAIASQGGVALENARLMNKNRELISLLNQTNERLTEENKLLRSRIEGRYDFSRIIGHSPAMETVFDLMSRVLASDATVLIRGETGTGKELIANAIHYNSPRKDFRFVAQNCAALPENLLESELFGYKKGAFSGAGGDKEGLISLANGGTLFLDEIGDMPMGLQAKLLRVIQEKEVRPLGSTESRKVNVRFVAATHCDLEKKISKGEFREDLFYRLSVYPIEIPPLRLRKEDYPALLQHFLSHLSELYQKQITAFSPKALDLLNSYDFPGNIREMRNIVERAVLLCVENGTILAEHLPVEVQAQTGEYRGESAVADGEDDNGSLKELMESYEARAILRTLEGLNWNQTKAAAALGIGRRTLITKMQRYQLRSRN